MTKGELKAALALADEKGQPDSAVVQVNGNGISSTYHIQLGKFQEGSTEVVEIPPAFMLVQ